MRMRTILLIALLSLACGLTAMSLVVIHNVLQRQIRQKPRRQPLRVHAHI